MKNVSRDERIRDPVVEWGVTVGDLLDALPRRSHAASTPSPAPQHEAPVILVQPLSGRTDPLTSPPVKKTRVAGPAQSAPPPPPAPRAPAKAVAAPVPVTVKRPSPQEAPPVSSAVKLANKHRRRAKHTTHDASRPATYLTP